jgi:ATP/maltotriose-dependent transcriptional regulator MalT
VDEASTLVADARRYAGERKMQHMFALIDFADAQVAATRGDYQTALDLASRAEQSAGAMGMRPLLWQIQALISDSLTTLGQTSAAEAKRRDARATVDDMADFLDDAELRTLFTESVRARVN